MNRSTMFVSCFLVVFVYILCGCSAKQPHEAHTVIRVSAEPRSEYPLFEEDPPTWVTHCILKSELKPPSFNLLSYPQMNLETQIEQETRLQFRVPEYQENGIRIDPELWQEMYVGRIIGNFYISNINKKAKAAMQLMSNQQNLRWYEIAPRSYKSSFIGLLSARTAHGEIHGVFSDLNAHEECRENFRYLFDLDELDYKGKLFRNNAGMTGLLSFQPEYVELILPGSGPICVQVNS